MTTQHNSVNSPWPTRLFGIVAASLVFMSLVLIFFVAPTEASMGDVQRILYLHISVAWFGLVGCIAAAICGGAYLTGRRPTWDHWSRAAAEVGWLSTTLTLITGSAWAHEAWGTWWTWEPRLTSSLILWLLYAGVFQVRSHIADPTRRARVSAVLMIVAASDVPLVVMATRWFRGIHPVSPEMVPAMRYVLLAAVLSFSVFFAYLIASRKRVLAQEEQVAELAADQWLRLGVIQTEPVR